MLCGIPALCGYAALLSSGPWSNYDRYFFNSTIYFLQIFGINISSLVDLNGDFMRTAISLNFAFSGVSSSSVNSMIGVASIEL